MSDEERPNPVLVEDRLWVLSRPTGMPAYDFALEDFFACRHPFRRPEAIRAVARMGAASDYAQRYEAFESQGVELIHAPAEYDRTSLLPHWYPLIEDLTPRSRWWLDRRPSASEIGREFRWPVFLKGARQTSRHQKSLSVATSAAEYDRVMAGWDADPILCWQGLVCREYVDLRKVGVSSDQTLPTAFEFRSFWWRGACVGIGPYWKGVSYAMTPAERAAALAIAGEAARRLAVTFLVVDVAQTAAGAWTVIECNDGQDSGYAGVAPMPMWRKILDVEAGAA